MPTRSAFTRLALALLVAIFLSAAADGQSKKKPVADDSALVSKLDWIAGEWTGSAWGGTYVAYYSTPDGGKVLSSSKLLKEDKVVFHEFEMFEVTNGELHMQPYPGGKPAARFKLKSIDRGARIAVFVNPENDYPKQIEYSCKKKNRLVITLSNPDGKSEVFDLGRK